MSGKRGTSVSRQELGRRLEEVARLLPGGHIEIEGAEISVPGAVRLKQRYKEKNGRAKVKISFSWPLPELTAAESGPARPAARRSAIDLKEAKKGMRQALNRMKTAVSAGSVPSGEDLAEYEVFQRIFADSARPEWRTGLQEIQAAFVSLQVACLVKDTAAAIAAIDDLFRLKDLYHSRFK